MNKKRKATKSKGRGLEERARMRWVDFEVDFSDNDGTRGPIQTKKREGWKGPQGWFCNTNGTQPFSFS